MADAKLSSTQDIEKLKQKIAIYRDTLATLKSGHTIDDYLFMKSELNGFKTQVTQLEEVLGKVTENRHTQIETYERQVDVFLKQIGSLNETVEELNQDLSIVMKKITHNPQEKNSTTTDKEVVRQEDSQADTLNLIKDISTMSEQSSQNHTSTKLPLFKKLQSHAGKVSNRKYIPNKQEKEVDIKEDDNHIEQIFNYKNRFPAVSNQPNQINNGLYKNVDKSVVYHVTTAAKKIVIPMVESNQASVQSKEQSESIPTYNQFVEKIVTNLPNEKTTAVREEGDSNNNVVIEEPQTTLHENTVVEESPFLLSENNLSEENESPMSLLKENKLEIGESGEVFSVASIEKMETFIEENDSQIEENEPLIEVQVFIIKEEEKEKEKEVEKIEVLEMKRQQHKNKESLFSIFRKKF